MTDETKKQITSQEFAEKLKDIMGVFYEQVHKPMVNLLLDFKATNPETNTYSVSGYEGVKQLDDMAMLTAWMLDKLDNRQDCFTGGKDYRGSKTKAIRKALGYTL